MQDLGPDVGVQELGMLDADQIVELLTKFSSLDPVRLVDTDPHVLINGRRGSFSAKPHQGKLLLQSTGGINAAFIELDPKDVPAWLDEPEGFDSGEAAATIEQAITVTPTTGRNMALGLLAISLLVLVFSAYYTFRPHPLIAEEIFTPISDPALLSSLQQQVVGLYVHSDGDSKLLVSADGKIVFIETADPAEPPDETVDQYKLAIMAGTGAVLLGADFGEIIIRNANTLEFYGEDFVRQP